MAGIGIEQFRNAAASGTSRIALGQGAQVVKAPLSLMGRVVAWRRWGGAASDQLRVENRLARATFHQALTKAYGQPVADAVLAYRFGSAGTFDRATDALSGATVTRVIQDATRLMKRVREHNRGAADRFVAQGRLLPRLQQTAAARNIPAGLLTDPAIATAFKLAVSQHPEFGRRPLTDAEMGQVAQVAIDAHFNDQQARFDATYSGLAQLSGPPAPIANPPFKETATVFADLQARVQAGGTLYSEPNNFAQHAQSALTAVQRTPALLGRTEFGQPGIGQHINLLTLQWRRLRQAEQDLAGVGGPLTPEAGALDGALRAEITAQKTAIEGKLQFYNEYLENDTLSEKQAAYHKLMCAEAGAVMIRDTIERLGLHHQPGDPAFVALTNARNQITGQARQEWQAAPTDQRIDRNNLPFKRDKAEVKQAVQEAYRAAAQQTTDAAVKRALLQAAGDVGKGMKKAQLKAINESQTWQPIVRRMVVSREGVTKTYTSEIIPASATNSRVGHDYQAQGLGGVGAGTKDDPVNARNLQVSRLKDQNGVVKHRAVRHGVLDPWEAGSSKQRRQAARAHADQVLHLAVEETAPNFKARLLAEAANPNPPQFKHTHVNFNLTTPVDRVVAAYNEGTFTQNQFHAFQSHNGQKQYDIFDSNNNNNVQTPTVDVDTITFSFGVNDLAQDPGAGWGFSERAWSNVYEHDKENLEKLVGDLQVGTAVGGRIGAVIERLEQAAAQGDPQAARLKTQIQKQVDIARAIFTSGDFRKGNGDPYKMVRHTMRIIDLSADALDHLGVDTEALTQSQGCKSNKDRGGMADVENKAMAMIEDMGGEVLPDRPFNKEDQDIYNTALTCSGQPENQRLNTMLPGSKNAEEAAARINNPQAQEQAVAFEDETTA
jgi:phosphatidylinositol-4,5-bisphosphate 4-phosphatase